jgi:hypothetical protein
VKQPLATLDNILHGQPFAWFAFIENGVLPRYGKIKHATQREQQNHMQPAILLYTIPAEHGSIAAGINRLS